MSRRSRQPGATHGGASTAQDVYKSLARAATTDLVLFAAILECEAGSSGYDGLLAVATVIMNRVESPRYPNTLKGVIYQSGQFSPCILYTSEAADEPLCGTKRGPHIKAK